MRVLNITCLLLNLITSVALMAVPNSVAACPTHSECVLRVSHQDQPTDINPANGTGTWSMGLVVNIFEGLFTIGEDGMVIPGQVEEWYLSDDGRTYTFRLRDDVFWSDGVPVTADDFVVTWRQQFLTNSNGMITYLLQGLAHAEDVEAGHLPADALGLRSLDDRTIEMRLSHPQSHLLAILANPFLAPAPRHVVSLRGPTESWLDADELVFNGAYVMTGTLSDNPIQLRKNPRYHGAERVYFDKVEISIEQEDERETTRRLLAGEIDIARLSDRNHAEVTENQDLITDPVANGVYLTFNVDRPVLKNLKVRQALAMTAWPDDLISDESGVAGLYSLLPPGIQGYPNVLPQPAWSTVSLEQRILDARTLMEHAGYSAKNPLKLSLKMLDYSTERNLARTLENIWRQIHVDLNVTFNTIGEHYSHSHLKGGHFEIGQITWFADFNDAHNFLSILRKGDYPNLGNWWDAHYESLLNLYERSNDPDNKEHYVRQMLTILIEKSVMVPLYQRQRENLARSDVRGFAPNPMGIHPYRHVYRSTPRD